ncbi:MAG: hypothetical protein AB7U98_11760 [Candidatus Nitrosocosmicus sp.]|jgi:hypothetical protein
MKNNVRHNIMGRQIENSLSDLESDKVKEFAIGEYRLCSVNRF